MGMMNEKKKQLEDRGWVKTSVEDFLGLTPKESRYIESRLLEFHNRMLIAEDASIELEDIDKMLVEAYPEMRVYDTTWGKVKCLMYLADARLEQIISATGGE
jgi:hypothetical protein